MSGAYDAIVVGSGVGGAMAARELVHAGLRVLMLERGTWVERGPHNWLPAASVDLTPHYSFESPYRVVAGGQRPIMGAYSCVGGPSVFWGGVSLRLRERDFEPDAEIVGDSGAAWPLRYADLEPYYARAEGILGVSGCAGLDPTEPPRSAAYPQPAPRLFETPQLIERVGRELGLYPFPLPLAINFAGRDGRPTCVACTTCDTFACAVSAKNDMASCVLPGLIAKGMALRPETVAVRLEVRDGRVRAVECVDKREGRRVVFEAPVVVLSAGALGSPHLLLASELAALNSAGDAVGRHLTRHVNGMTFGMFPRLPDRGQHFQKQLAFMDFYFGDPEARVRGKLGSIQQMQAPSGALVTATAPAALKPVARLVTPALSHVTGLLCMAEDQPRPENHVTLDPGRRDRFGLPQLVVTHRYTPRDEAARDALLRRARGVLRAAGARVQYAHHVKTFSHAAGTVRFGEDPRTAPLDPWCRFRGVPNLFVVDASFLPTGGGVNPSLTIAANALRVGEAIGRGALS